MKRSLWLLMLFLLAGHVPAASADSACEGRFVNPITDICWSCIFPLSLGSIKVSQGKVPDTANPSMPIQICPAPPPLFRRIGLAIGYWEPMALTDVTRSPGCMVTRAAGHTGTRMSRSQQTREPVRPTPTILPVPWCHTSVPFTPKKVPVCMNMPRTPVSQKHPGK